ncbi:hypothetical protein ABIF68_005567 [Bradyrhizobium japonicum]
MQSFYQFLDAPLPNLRALGLLDRIDVLLPKGERQTVERDSRLRMVVERGSEIVRFGNDSRCIIDFNINFDHVAFTDACSCAVRGADPYQSLPAHRRHSAAPRMAVDRNRYERSRLRSKRAHDILGNFNSRSISGRDDFCLKLHPSTACIADPVQHPVALTQHEAPALCSNDKVPDRRVNRRFSRIDCRR